MYSLFAQIKAVLRMTQVDQFAVDSTIFDMYSHSLVDSITPDTE